VAAVAVVVMAVAVAAVAVAVAVVTAIVGKQISSDKLSRIQYSARIERALHCFV
jgi:hypothetical protein